MQQNEEKSILILIFSILIWPLGLIWYFWYAESKPGNSKSARDGLAIALVLWCIGMIGTCIGSM